MTRRQVQRAPVREVEAFSALVSDIYDTVLDPERWPDALRALAHYVGGPAAGLYAKDAAAKTGNLFYGSTDGIAPEYAERYFTTYVRLDVSNMSHYFMDVGDVAGTADLLDYAEFTQSRFYREWAVPQGLVDFISTVIDKTATSVTMVGVFRSQRDGLADDDSCQRMRLIAPHIRRAVLLGRVLEHRTARADALTDMIDAVRAGMVLVDADGRIVHANAAALSMIAEGNVLADANGRLIATDPDAAQALSALFARTGEGAASIGDSGVALPLTGRDGARYAATLLPLTSGDRRGSSLAAVAMLFIQRAELSAPAAPELIARAYALTPSELRVLLAIVEVGGPAEVAESIGVAESTVRFHLKRLFDKTGAHRQADLVKLVAGYATPLHR